MKGSFHGIDKTNKVGKDGSVYKGVCCQAQQLELHIWACMMEESPSSHKLSLDLDMHAKACAHAAHSPQKKEWNAFFISK